MQSVVVYTPAQAFWFNHPSYIVGLWLVMLLTLTLYAVVNWWAK